MTLLRKLLRYPHRAVFDVSADAEPAFFLSGPQDAAWEIADEQLSITCGETVHVYALSDYSVGSLKAALADDGFAVSEITVRFAGHAATVLVEGKGAVALSNGSHIMGFTNLIWSLFAAYACVLRQARVQIGEALKQMVIWHSEGEWLDLWGKLFDVAREGGEGDAAYARRVPEEAFRLRVNRYAIEKAIRDMTGKTVHITEPWEEMFRLDESRLSSFARLPDGERYRYGYIQPVAPVPIDWDDVLAVIERNRAAGVIVLNPESQTLFPVNGRMTGGTIRGGVSQHGILVRAIHDDRLDWMRLGNTRPHRNWKMGVSDVRIHASCEPVTGCVWWDTVVGSPVFSVAYSFPTAVVPFGVGAEYGCWLTSGSRADGHADTLKVLAVSAGIFPKTDRPKITTVTPAGLCWTSDRPWDNAPWDDIIERETDEYLISECGQAVVTENGEYILL